MHRRHPSLRTKLNLLLAVSAGTALCMSCAVFVTNDLRMMRSAKTDHLLALADTLGVGAVNALARGDLRRAERVLNSLQAHPSVVYASLHDNEGKVFARYRAPGTTSTTSPPPLPPANGAYFTDDGHLGVLGLVHLDGRPVGSVYLHAALNDLRAELLHYLRVVALVILASLSAAVLISSRLQRLVTEPILRLTRTAQQIAAAGDYSVRVQKGANDELGILCDEFNRMLERIAKSDKELQEARDLLEQRVDARTAQLSRANVKLSREIAERQRAEEELVTLHEQLIEAAHRAGMAEIATDVLHNVGNVLNSVNVSCTLVAERLRTSSVPQVQRLAELVNEQRERLGEFLSNDPRGGQVPEFLSLLAAELRVEREALLDEVGALVHNIDHIKQIVAMQQSYAGVSGLVEAVSLEQLFDDALRLHAPWIAKYQVEVVRQFEPLPEIRLQKQKLLQVLVNLLQNARDALLESGRGDPRLVLRINRTPQDAVRIEVSDNGLGIADENLTRIFSHGFTTKAGGHGFGLHASANAVQQMGGKLAAASEGPGTGATFTIELPLEAVEVPV
ncbi:MAG: HAMP domain-containing protein [Pirellulales bacterium]|nr:HAMP domain-containing protein [Pirellulales bacterium]